MSERKGNERFVVSGQGEFHYRKTSVIDNYLQIEVFHWYGFTGPAKCEAVAKALNDLGHEKD